MVAGARQDDPQDVLAQTSSESEPLVDGLCRALADAAARGLLLASGPLSRRKTQWLLSELTSELRQAERLVEALRERSTEER